MSSYLKVFKYVQMYKEHKGCGIVHPNGGELWHVDSTRMPRILSRPDFRQILQRFPTTYAVLDCAHDS